MNSCKRRNWGYEIYGFFNCSLGMIVDDGSGITLKGLTGGFTEDENQINIGPR